ncbi:TerC family protein [Paenibacillus sp. ATY16]|uniref:TerC family protein n=1 Tax=Paenibacillus sp. ATY16 TaxID=1759312 RepID=UPI00200ED1FD|nr:TerC family protein [Paenibacillus sp. ATY16]MCK9860169.1 TerC family protein [Paenibacillus sp. ATY16]
MTPFEFLTTLLSIVFIDLILAGDNAIVIGMAAKRLPKETQKKAILYGTCGAILLRIVATVLVVYLLNIPWLLVAGGVILLWIAYKLLVQEEDHENIKAGSTLWGSVWTIIIADAAMGLDNVIAVAGAAQGHTLLVIIGLIISIPIVVWGSTLFIKLLSKFPWIIYAGSAVLAYTASKMITHEPAWKAWFEENQVVKWLVIAIAVVAVLGAGLWTNAWKKKHPQAAHE